LTEDGHLKRQHRLPSKLTMMIPAFRGVDCLMGPDGKGIGGLANPPGLSSTNFNAARPSATCSRSGVLVISAQKVTLSKCLI
jgi:hypothetical protein